MINIYCQQVEMIKQLYNGNCNRKSDNIMLFIFFLIFLIKTCHKKKYYFDKNCLKCHYSCDECTDSNFISCLSCEKN